MVLLICTKTQSTAEADGNAKVFDKVRLSSGGARLLDGSNPSNSLEISVRTTLVDQLTDNTIPKASLLA